MFTPFLKLRTNSTVRNDIVAKIINTKPSKPFETPKKALAAKTGRIICARCARVNLLEIFLKRPVFFGTKSKAKSTFYFIKSLFGTTSSLGF